MRTSTISADTSPGSPHPNASTPDSAGGPAQVAAAAGSSREAHTSSLTRKHRGASPLWRLNPNACSADDESGAGRFADDAGIWGQVGGQNPARDRLSWLAVASRHGPAWRSDRSTHGCGLARIPACTPPGPRPATGPNVAGRLHRRALLAALQGGGAVVDHVGGEPASRWPSPIRLARAT